MLLSSASRVVLDANVLFPLSLRDTLLRAAERGVIQVHWSVEILEETRRNLVATMTITEAQAQRLVETMKVAFPDAMVSDYMGLIADMKNDEGDRHVAAAAVKCGARVIVTSNLADFRELPKGIKAMSPDDFLTNLLEADPSGMVDQLERQAGALRRPPRSFEELLAGLGKLVPGFVRVVREYVKAGQ
ncbi:MAG: PIN domain-containing protein [Deltaproteobacteria bacterium]|nr:PIN domain-containing protein [Deltaproteobacteria bacterium]